MDVVFHLYHTAKSRRDFYRKMEGAGLTLTYKDNRVIGFRDVGGRKFSLAKIGIREQELEHLDMKQERELLRAKERIRQLERQAPQQKLQKRLSPYHKR